MNKVKIKVIKKNDIATAVKEVEKPQVTERLKKKAIVNNITGWVEDLQKRRFLEARASVDRFVRNEPHKA